MTDNDRESHMTRHNELMEKLDRLIAQVYRVKDKYPHQQVWFVTSAIDIFKRQSSVVLRHLMSGACTPEERRDLLELKAEMTDAMKSVFELTVPMIKGE